MEIIYVVLAAVQMILCRLAYDLGKRTGKVRFINKRSPKTTYSRVALKEFDCHLLYLIRKVHSSHSEIHPHPGTK